MTVTILIPQFRTNTQLYTSLGIETNNTLREKSYLINDAVALLVHGYVNEVVVEFTNDGFISNSKPDGTMTKRLDLIVYIESSALRRPGRKLR